MLFSEWLNSKSIDKKLIDEYGKYKIYIVDGEKVRNSSLGDEEFGEFAVHSFFPKLIPEDEIWIENDVKPEEYPFMIANALEQLKNKKLGKNKAYDLGLRKEKIIRQQSSGIKLKSQNTPPKSLYVKKYEIKDGFNIWLVNGEVVRDLYKTDFLEGGNGMVYSFVPKNEIWVENGIDRSEIKYIILHEMTEFKLMKDKHLPYLKAHRLASKKEFEARCKN